MKTSTGKIRKLQTSLWKKEALLTVVYERHHLLVVNISAVDSWSNGDITGDKNAWRITPKSPLPKNTINQEAVFPALHSRLIVQWVI